MQSGIAEVYLGEGRLRMTAHACTLGGVQLFFGCYSFATSISSLKKLLGLPPQLELHAVVICKSGHDNKSE